MEIATPLPTEAQFWAFAAQVPIASRDTGFGVIEPWGTQRHLIHEIFDGLNQGVHQFVVLKGGQVGASLIIQLLTKFWYRCSPGLQGVCVADSDEVREFFRDQFTLMMANEPEAEIARTNNKNQIAWQNGSRLLFQTSGVRTGARLGVGRGFAFAHGTEVPLWQNPNALTYLRTRASDTHPHRLQVYEGTARGKNWFFDLWTDAEGAVDIKRIFLGWWLREDYSLHPESSEFSKYWDNRLTMKERQSADALKRRYNIVLKPEQWAWHRWYTAEKAGGDQRIADQEEPTLPEYAFEATGQSFLGHELIQRCRKSLKKVAKAKSYKYEFGARIEESAVLPTTHSLSDLSVWENPSDAEAYVVAAVPSHSSNPKCPTGAVSVWKASRDSLEQVAEFSRPDCGLNTFSWVCTHLISSYRVQRRTFILEIAGAGMGVLQELKRLQQCGWGTRAGPEIRKLVGPIQHYLWRRTDSMGGGVAYQWKTTNDLETWLLRRLKDQLETGAVVLRSHALLSECERMRQIDDGFESEGKVEETHRLMAAALAVESWASQLRPQFARVQGARRANSVMGRVVTSFFDQLNARPA